MSDVKNEKGGGPKLYHNDSHLCPRDIFIPVTMLALAEGDVRAGSPVSQQVPKGDVGKHEATVFKFTAV